ncbi:G-type lectin S-receptor-like serine/threonine-protein kinase SD2-5 isoform X3 [Cannabis sativa]|uniref:G-type lectin S-receptor-like serine/threonine-protein kinase SD2-5 isoform X3 n=1 Tax=Cannabis sativa TaxID=3483 RepID=UPI0029C9D5FA|nr:G-type lectin S-receptor-like serine/threonine-protein kinase SD2-5 isoform X3 [Cannabis sativa]
MHPHYYSYLIFWLLVTTILFKYGYCESSSIGIGYQFTLPVVVGISSGRAYLMESSNEIKNEPNFKVALSVEAIEEKFFCCLEVFLGDVKVWNSCHYTRFYMVDKCVLDFTQDGVLNLKGSKDTIGWTTATSGQGVQRLQILRTGNLVLVDGLNNIKWQSFNFPTDVMLWGQRLNVATRLTSFPSNSTSFYSLEIKNNKIGLYLNSGDSSYSYWEFKPSMNRNLTFMALSSKGLELFNDQGKKIAQIRSRKYDPPLRFLALGNKTGNLGLYFYSPSKAQFEASFQALNTTCDLPLACKPYGICTFSNACSCIRLLKEEEEEGVGSGCGEGFRGGFCGGGVGGKNEVDMVELEDVKSVLRDYDHDYRRGNNVSKTQCLEMCLDDCKCVGASFNSQACFLYKLVGGLKQVDRGSGMSFLVKVPKGSTTSGTHGKSNVKKWVVILVGVVDGMIILLVFGGVAYYLIRKKRNSHGDTPHN